MSFHLLSPLLYMLFVKAITYIQPCPQSNNMKTLRKYHNICLSFLSLVMLVGITYGTYYDNKFNSINHLFCLQYSENPITYYSVYLFLYSKYLEWGDTLFLHLSGKPITTLQYTHHMSTALLVYVHAREFISPLVFLYQGLNCLVHVPMYLYFAYPKGFLYKFRKNITQFQIYQHIICIISTIYIKTLDNCEQNKYGLELGLSLYFMYLFYFSIFYIKSYNKKKKTL